MASVNKWIGIGNLGRDPELRTFPSGDQVANVTIACTDKWKDRQTGEIKEHTEWVRIVFNGRLAEICNQYLRKGSLVYVEGSLRTRKYQKDGVDHYATEIRADQMRMLDKRQDGQQGSQGYDQGQAPAPRNSAPARPAPAPQRQAPAPTSNASSGFDDMDDDIHF